MSCSSSRITRRSARWATRSAELSRRSRSRRRSPSQESKAGPPAARPSRRSGTTGSTAHRSRTAWHSRSKATRGRERAHLGRGRGPAHGPGVLRLRDRRRIGGNARRAASHGVHVPPSGCGAVGSAPPGRGRRIPRRRPLPGAGGAARAGSPPCRPLARRADRLLPARDPPQPAARVPPRAHGARPPQLPARLLPYRSAAGAAEDRGRHARVALLSSTPRLERPPPATRARAARDRALERPDAVRDAADRARAASRPDRRGLRRELGSHRGQRRDLERPRPLCRPERGDAGGSRPLPRRGGAADRRDRLAAGRRVPPSAAPRGVRRASRRLRARRVKAGRRRDGQHTDEHAVRGSVLRAPGVVVGRERRGPALLAALPAAPARPRLAGALRCGARQTRRGRAGAELHRPRGAGDGPPARRRRRLERRDDPARRPGQRPAGGLRPLRRGRTAGRVVGAQERGRRALPRRRRLRRVLRGAVVRRGRSGDKRCLRDPGELRDRRRAVVERVVGPVDGRSADRVVEAILDGVGA